MKGKEGHNEQHGHTCHTTNDTTDNLSRSGGNRWTSTRGWARTGRCRALPGACVRSSASKTIDSTGIVGIRTRGGRR